jgi:hypothetical protein
MKTKWRLAIFLAENTVQTSFSWKGTRMVISPGVIDMGGLLITPAKVISNGSCDCCGEDLQEVSLEERLWKKQSRRWHRST